MSVKEITHRIDFGLANASDRYGLWFLRFSIGLIYVWFGALKFFPNMSPAEDLAADTLSVISFHLIDKAYLLLFLALWEVGLGLFLMSGIKSKFIIWALLLHMLGTLTPMFIFPEMVFTNPPLGFSIVGQYIMKNFVIIGAALVIYNRNK